MKQKYLNESGYEYFINETFKTLRYKQSKYGVSSSKIEGPTPFTKRNNKLTFNKTEILYATNMQTPSSEKAISYNQFTLKSNSQSNTPISKPSHNARRFKTETSNHTPAPLKPYFDAPNSKNTVYLFEKLKPSQAFKLRCTIKKKPNKIEKFYLDGNKSIESVLRMHESGEAKNEAKILIKDNLMEPQAMNYLSSDSAGVINVKEGTNKVERQNTSQTPFKIYDTSFLQAFFLKELNKGNTLLEKFFDEDELTYFLGKCRTHDIGEEDDESISIKRVSILYANKIKKSLKRNTLEDRNFLSSLINSWRDSTKRKRRIRRYFTRGKNEVINYDSLKFKLKILIIRLSRLHLKFSELPFVFPKRPFQKKGSFMFFQALRHENIEMIEKMLQDSRFYLFDFDFKGRTPLHLAAKKGFFDICKTILKHFPDLDKTDLFDRTPLFYSLAYGHRRISKLLLYHRADPWSKGPVLYTKLIPPNDPDTLRALKSARKLDLVIRFSPLKSRGHIWNKQRIIILKSIEEGEEKVDTLKKMKSYKSTEYF